MGRIEPKSCDQPFRLRHAAIRCFSSPQKFYRIVDKNEKDSQAAVYAMTIQVPSVVSGCAVFQSIFKRIGSFLTLSGKIHSIHFAFSYHKGASGTALSLRCWCQVFTIQILILFG